MYFFKIKKMFSSMYSTCILPHQEMHINLSQLLFPGERFHQPRLKISGTIQKEHQCYGKA